ncbi:MAG: hypothetical protein DRR06_11860 [Gammaproteobacteria bacterium]|nr:MAG: hypothetical protein DRR06_11860 [Gammaproteobacteria bacterium]
MWDYPALRKVTIAIAIALVSQVSLAQETRGRVLGDGTPFGLQDIPRGRAKEKIQSLPPRARERALEWLNRFSFPVGDFEYLNFDSEGGVFYEDTVLPEDVAEADGSSGEASSPVTETAANVFALHSKPGSSKVLYVDFDGHEITATVWNNGGPDSYYAAPFSLDSDDATFSDSEKASIQEIWHRIAEDFAPFDIDVTTEEPGVYTNSTGHVLITRDVDTSGQTMPYNTAGGVAYVGVWGSSSFTYYSPALVYYDNLAKFAPYISEAASHEVGHNLGLSHDGSSTNSYYSGHGSGYISWAPIMGVGYYNNVTQWSSGEYSGATQPQDDIAIITNRLSLRDDDHSDSSASATELILTGGTAIEVSNPEADADNIFPENKGLIEDRNDVDTFTFVSGGGTIDITATPAWDAYYRTSRRGANLDIELALLDDTGVIAVSDPADDTFAQISFNSSAGRYYLQVTGVGNNISPYSDYGSLGQYFISGTLPATTGGDDTAPNPNRMTWSVTPYEIGRGSIQMTATTANDDSGIVEYQFICLGGGSGCTSSAWQSSTEYVATGLAADTSYSYQVSARDLSNNITTASISAAATTLANLPPVASNDFGSTDEDVPIVISVLGNDSDPEGDNLNIISVSSGANGTTTTNGNTITYTPATNYSGNDSFSYTVGDGFGGTASANVTVTVSETNDAPSAVNDSASVGTNSTITIDVLANDTDREGDQLTLVSVSSGNKGTASVSGDLVSYSSGKKRGTDTLTYTVSDGNSTSVASISVSIRRNSTTDDGGGGGGGGGGGKCHPKRGCQDSP